MWDLRAATSKAHPASNTGAATMPHSCFPAKTYKYSYTNILENIKKNNIKKDNGVKEE